MVPGMTTQTYMRDDLMHLLQASKKALLLLASPEYVRDTPYTAFIRRELEDAIERAKEHI